MKKLTALLPALAMCLSLLTACGSGDTVDPQVSPSADPSESISQPVEETPDQEPSVEEPAVDTPSVEEPSEAPSQDVSGDVETVPAEPAFALSSSDFTLFSAGSSWTLEYTADPVLDESPVFTSEDESVATVAEDGTVTAVAPGKTRITATYGDFTASCIVRCRWEEAADQPSETPSQAPASVDLNAFVATLANKYGENFPANANLVEYGMVGDFFPGLTDIPTNQLVAYQPMMGAVVCEIVLVEVADEADVDAVKAILQTRIDAQVNGGAWYPESIEGWQNNSRIVSDGRYVMMIAYQNCDAVVSAFKALF